MDREQRFAESLREMQNAHGPYHSYSFNADGLMVPRKDLGVFFDRLLTIVNDVFQGTPHRKLRILDLGSYEGVFSLGFARLGADVVSVEGREAGVMKLKFAADALKLKNVRAIHSDVRQVTREHYGKFDLVLACGVMYHLDAHSVFEVAANIFDMTKKAAIIDTHIALSRPMQSEYGGQVYWGKPYREFPPGTLAYEKARNLAAALDNDESFWLTRISWLNLLKNLGFGTVYESLLPSVQQERGFYDRITMVALKNARPHGFFSETSSDGPLEEQIDGKVYHSQGDNFSFST